MRWADRVALVTSVVLSQHTHMQSCMCQECRAKRGEVDAMFWNNAQRRIPPMLMIDLPRGRIGLHFRHKPYAKPTLNTEICSRSMNGHTRCDIYSLDGRDAKLLASGRGIAKAPDAFNKSLGRKFSLTSALRCTDPGSTSLGRAILVFDRDDRQMIWEAYWKSISPGAGLPPASSITGMIDGELAATELAAVDVSGVPMLE